MDPTKTRVLISLLSDDGKRIARDLTITGGAGETLTGRTRDESADMNDILMLELPRGTTWTIVWQQRGGDKIMVERKTDDADQTWWNLHQTD